MSYLYSKSLTYDHLWCGKSFCVCVAFYWLMNKETGLAYSKVNLGEEIKQNTGRKEAESKRRYIAAMKKNMLKLAGRSQPCGDTQINGYGLN